MRVSLVVGLFVALGCGVTGVEVEEGVVSLLLNTGDFHAAKDGKFMEAVDDDDVAFLHISEEDVPLDAIVKEHDTAEEARDHMMSFLEETVEMRPAAPTQQYIYGTAFPPTMYPHIAGDFPMAEVSTTMQPAPLSSFPIPT